MQFFAWGMNRPGVKDERAAIIQQHWDYIARFEETLIARGPVFDPNDLGKVIGSIHIFESDDWESAKRFVFDEPFAAAGLFEEVILTRFMLGSDHTQFEFKSKRDWPRFFCHCPAQPGMAEKRDVLRSAHLDYLKGYADNLVCNGALLTGDGTWNGAVYFLELPTVADAEKFLADEPYNKAGILDNPRIHRWTMGGPGNLNASGTLGS
jgi:uncharacterized protein YciI